MKKALVTFILIAILISSNIVTMASEFTDLGIKIKVPSEYYDLKSGIDNNDTKITYYETVLKTTRNDLKKQYAQNGIIYNGISANLSKGLIISVIENSRTKRDHHLTLLNDEEIEQLKQELVDAASGMQKQEQNVYENNSIKYVYTAFKNGTSTVYQYYTIVNGKSITITLNSKYSNIKQDELKKIVDTIEFNTILEKPLSLTSNPVLVVGTIVIMVIIVIIAIIVINKKNKKEN